jgi:hypothetical protein
MKVRFWSTEYRSTGRSILLRLPVLSAYPPIRLLPTYLLLAIKVGPQGFRDDD